MDRLEYGRRGKTPAYAGILLGVLLGSLLLARPTRAQAAFIDPDSLTATSDFNPNMDVSIDATAGTMSGGANGNAYSVTQAGSPVWVFVFNTFTLPPGINLTFYGTRPVVFLCRGDMMIAGNIHADSILSAPAPGGFSGGHTGALPGYGSGPGGGTAVAAPGNSIQPGGGGGGFGGAGGDGSIGQSTPGPTSFSRGGIAYGGLKDQLAGGSGGAGGASTNTLGGGGGGAGGGAIQFGAAGTLTVAGTATISANGGAGSSGDGSGGGGGGGSGGGILFQSVNIDLEAGAAITADGGDSGMKGGGGGGGGGRIEVYYRTTGSNSAALSVDGGAIHTSPGAIPAGTSFPGSIIFAQSDAVPPLPFVPRVNQTPTITLRGKKKITTIASSVTIKGTASDDAGLAKITVRVGRKGKPQSAKGTTAWSFKAILKPGSNSIAIVATDSDGATSSPARLTVIRKSVH